MTFKPSAGFWAQVTAEKGSCPRFLNNGKNLLQENQPKIFLICVGFGFFFALLRDFASSFLWSLKGSKWEGRAWTCFEITFFFAFALGFVALQAWLRFPDLRGYTFVGIGVGFWLYLKTLRIILAFFKKVCYNILEKRIRKRKNSNIER